MSTKVEKLWGFEEVFWNGTYCMKALFLNPGFQSSLHYHLEKHETFLIVDGCCDLEILGKDYRLVRGDYKVIPPRTPHRFKGVDGKCLIIEASTRHEDSDVVRLEESRKIE